MGFILSVYSINAFKEFLLPAIDNADSSIMVGKSIFALPEDVIIPLEIVGGQWFIRKKKFYLTYTVSGANYTGHPLVNGDLLTLTLPEGHILNIIVKEVRDSFIVYKKYDISGLDKIRIGKDESCDICYETLNLISKEHGTIRKDGAWYVVEDTSMNGIFINSMRMKGSWQLSFGDCIDIFGLRMVFLGNVLAINTELDRLRLKEDVLPVFRADKRRDEKQYENQDEDYAGQSETQDKIFHRSPRKLYRLEKDVVKIEVPPVLQKEDGKTVGMLAGPALAMALPMFFGCSLIIYSSVAALDEAGVFRYAGMALAAGAAFIGSVWTFAYMLRGWMLKREERKRRVEIYQKYLTDCASLVGNKYEKSREALIEMYPSAEECCKYTEESPELWGRNASHEDMLFERLGLGDVPFQVEVSVSEEKFALPEDRLAEMPKVIRESYRQLKDVPVGVDLLQHRLIGVFGGEKKQGAIAALHMLAVQIAANNCYTDVKMAFIYDEKNYDDSSTWNFAKWLPHVWSEDRKNRYVAKDKQEAGDVFYELAKVFRIRQDNMAGDDAAEDIKPPKPYYVLFIADPNLLEGELISKYIYKPKKEYGLTTLMFAENYEQLPNACEYLIQNDEDFTGVYCIGDDSLHKQMIRFDIVAGVSLEAMARRLSRIKVSEVETGKELPDDLTFFEMYGIHSLSELHVTERWRKNRTYDSMKALIGQKAGGGECYLDVHEKFHGPHGLVAGTTGSGKSEILQTYILSLAINFSPEDVCFFIIDYKGGGMANLFSGLPHMVGQITNLSGSQVRRAMVSIKSENRRRQRIFNEYGVNNINLYTKLYKNKETAAPIPHLFIIIDEFAELKREEPDFMGELISVAQVGRSLGVHLILATQKPGGTVDENIWSNSRFRICLRVQDRQDSMHMLHKPDAAYITQTGRCCMQVGNDELYEAFQSGYSGAAYDENAERQDIAKMISNTGKTALIGSRARMKYKIGQDAEEMPEMRQKTQLEAVVKYLADTAAEENCGTPMQFWLPILPNELYLEELTGYDRTAYQNHIWRKRENTGSLDVYMGLCDDPVNQAQMPLILEPVAGGHMAVCGMAGSGKSTFLQTFVYSMICNHTPDEVNIYCIDFGSRMLAAFEQAPQVGGVILENESDRLAKFTVMLSRILEERKTLLGGGSFSQYVKAGKDVLPAILIVIDNFAGFRSKTEYRYDDLFTQLSKDGAGYGIFMALTASGFGTLDIPARMGDDFRTVIALEMGDRFRYAEVHKAARVDVIPEENVRGRGLAKVNETLLEFQTALAMRAENDFKRSEAIKEMAQDMQKAWDGKAAESIPEIPKNFIWQDFVKLRQVQDMLQDDRYLPLGYETDGVTVYGVDLSKTYCYLLSGQSGTGKTNAMKVLISAAHSKGGTVTVFDFTGELHSLCDKMNITCIMDDESCYCYFRDTLIPTFQERAKGDGSGKHFLFIANLAEFISHIYAPAGGVGEMGALVENLLDKGGNRDIFWFACLKQEDRNALLGRKAYELFVRRKAGVHFGGKVSEQRIFDFDHVPYTEKSRAEKTGVAMLPYAEEETVRKVAVPLWKE